MPEPCRRRRLLPEFRDLETLTQIRSKVRPLLGKFGGYHATVGTIFSVISTSIRATLPVAPTCPSRSRMRHPTLEPLASDSWRRAGQTCKVADPPLAPVGPRPVGGKSGRRRRCGLPWCLPCQRSRTMPSWAAGRRASVRADVAQQAEQPSRIRQTGPVPTRPAPLKLSDIGMYSARLVPNWALRAGKPLVHDVSAGRGLDAAARDGGKRFAAAPDRRREAGRIARYRPVRSGRVRTGLTVLAGRCGYNNPSGARVAEARGSPRAGILLRRSHRVRHRRRLYRRCAG
jgi:hypothetical protein